MSAPQLTYERAVEIVEACTSNGMYHILGDRGLGVPSLRGITLAEMVEAQGVVRDTEDARREASPGPHTSHVVCADRLVAALYVAANYPGDDPEEPEPICVLPDGRAVLVVRLPPDARVQS